MSVSYAGVDRRRPAGPGRAARAAALVTLGDRSLAGEVGAEVAASLSQALERLDEILRSGRVGRAGLNAVRDEVERARQIAMLGQQVSRLAAGLARATPEAVDLPEVLQAALRQQRQAVAARGLTLRQHLRPATVSADASLLFTLLQCVLQWALEHASGPVVRLSTELNSWPVHALLRCQFAWRAPDNATAGAPDIDRFAQPSGLDTLAWRLVEQAAAALGVQVQREETPFEVHLTLAFPEAARRWPKLVDEQAAATDDPAGPGGPALAGSQVLVLAARTELRRAAHAGLAPLGVDVLDAASVDELLARAASVQAVLVPADLPGLAALRQGLADAGGRPALVLVDDVPPGVHIDADGRQETCRIGQATMSRDLPAVLRYALLRM